MDSEKVEEKTIKEGYLLKRSKMKTWKKRWFVIRGSRLSLYKNDKEYELSKIFKLKDCSIRVGEKPKSYVFKITAESKSYYIKAANKIERSEWVDCLKEQGASMEEENELEDLGRNRSASIGMSDEDMVESPKDEKAIYSDNDNDGSDDDAADTLTTTEKMAREGVILQAYLLKSTSVRKIWKKRWVVLRLNGTLAYYKNDEEYELQNMIKLKDCDQVVRNNQPVKVKGKEVYTFTLSTHKKSFTFAALSAVEQESWVSELNILIKRKRSTETPPASPRI